MERTLSNQFLGNPRGEQITGLVCKLEGRLLRALTGKVTTDDLSEYGEGWEPRDSPLVEDLACEDLIASSQ